MKLVVVAVIAKAMNVAAQNKKAKPPKTVTVTANGCCFQSKRHISIAESSAVRSSYILSQEPVRTIVLSTLWMCTKYQLANSIIDRLISFQYWGAQTLIQTDNNETTKNARKFERSIR
jgi:hypothetical protein